MADEARLREGVIVLAAGRSSRAGQPKGLIEVGGRPWIELQLAALREAGLERVVVVLGHHRPAYERLLEGQGVDIAINPDPDRGPFSSLQCGLSVLCASAAVWVLPVDVPCPGKEVWSAMSQAGEGPGVEVVVPTFGGRGGHPVRLSQGFCRELLGLDPGHPSARLDERIRGLAPGRGIRQEVADARVLGNFNRLADFARQKA